MKRAILTSLICFSAFAAGKHKGNKVVSSQEPPTRGLDPGAFTPPTGMNHVGLSRDVLGGLNSKDYAVCAGGGDNTLVFYVVQREALAKVNSKPTASELFWDDGNPCPYDKTHRIPQHLANDLAGYVVDRLSCNVASNGEFACNGRYAGKLSEKNTKVISFCTGVYDGNCDMKITTEGKFAFTDKITAEKR